MSYFEMRIVSGDENCQIINEQTGDVLHMGDFTLEVVKEYDTNTVDSEPVLFIIQIKEGPKIMFSLAPTETRVLMETLKLSLKLLPPSHVSQT